MSDGMQGFIQTFFAAENLKNQRELLAMQQHNSQIERNRILTDIARLSTTPEGREAIGAMSQDPDFQEFVQLHNLAPSLSTIVERATVRGMEAMPEEETSAVERGAAIRALTGGGPGEFASSQFREQLLQGATPEEMAVLGPQARAREATGVTRGELALDEQLAALPPEEQQAAVRMMRGLELDAFEQEQVAKWAADNGLSWASLAQNGALGEVGLYLRALELDLAAAAGGGGGPADVSANNLLTQVDSSIRALSGITRTTPDATVLAEAARFNSAIVNLTRMGLMPANEQGEPIFPLLPMDVGVLRSRFDSLPLIRWMRGESGRPRELDMDVFLEGFPQLNQELLQGPGVAQSIGAMLEAIIQSRSPQPEPDR